MTEYKKIRNEKYDAVVKKLQEKINKVENKREIFNKGIDEEIAKLKD